MGSFPDGLAFVAVVRGAVVQTKSTVFSKKNQIAVTVSAATAHWAASAAGEEAGEVVGVTTVPCGTSNSEGVRRRAFIRPFRAPSSVSPPCSACPSLSFQSAPNPGLCHSRWHWCSFHLHRRRPCSCCRVFVAFSRSALRCALVQNQRRRAASDKTAGRLGRLELVEHALAGGVKQTGAVLLHRPPSIADAEAAPGGGRPRSADSQQPGSLPPMSEVAWSARAS